MKTAVVAKLLAASLGGVTTPVYAVPRWLQAAISLTIRRLRQGATPRTQPPVSHPHPRGHHLFSTVACDATLLGS